MAVVKRTNTRVVPANNRAVDVAQRAIQGVTDIHQRQAQLTKKQRKRFDTIMNASARKLHQLADKHLDSIGRRDLNKIRGLLLRKYVPRAISPCIVCGAELEYKGWVVGFENFGFPRYCDHHSRKEKQMATNRERYGYDWANHHPDVKAREEATRMQRYGVRTIFESPSIQKKIQKTFQARFGGGGSPMASKEVRDKVAATNLKKYGAESVLGSDHGRRKRKSTMIERYGSEHALQNVDSLLKASRSNAQNKRFVTRDQRVLNLRGYEPIVADFYEFEGYRVSQGRKRVCYTLDGKDRRYFPDLLVKKESRKFYIEVKSMYTLFKGFRGEGSSQNWAKFKAAHKKFKGKFRLAVFDKGRIFLVKAPHRFVPQELQHLLDKRKRHPNIRRVKWL